LLSAEDVSGCTLKKSGSSMKSTTKALGLSLLLVTAIQTPSAAGGSSWKVSIEKMQLQSSSQAVVVLKALENRVFDQECTELLIEIDYQPDYLRGGRELDLDRENAAYRSHKKALASLQTTYQKESPTRFGELMGGLRQKQTNRSWLSSLTQFFSQLLGRADLPSINSNISTECRFIASGLVLLEESSSQKVVYVRNEL
jgi:hypothetical protein